MRVICIVLLLSVNVFAEDVYDPLEGMNRRLFVVHDNLDEHFFNPIARGYKDVVPDPIENGVGNFFKNLRTPANLISNLLRFNFSGVWNDAVRFTLNSTVGLLGVIDVAKDLGFEHKYSDIGVTLASWGFSPGPYLLVPVIGPTNIRDGVGLIAEGFLSPLYWFGVSDELDSKTRTIISWGLTGLYYIDLKAGLLEATKTGKETSLDYYLFVQSSYYQYRNGLLKKENDDEDWFDDEFEDDEDWLEDEDL